MIAKTKRDKDLDKLAKQYQKLKHDLQDSHEQFNVMMQRVDTLQGELAKLMVEKMALMQMMKEFFDIGTKVALSQGIKVTDEEAPVNDTRPPGMG